MTTVADTDTHEEHRAPVSSALKNLAKVHNLPPFDRMYVSLRVVVIVTRKLDGCLWRSALGLPPFDAHGATEGFWMGDKVRLVKL